MHSVGSIAKLQWSDVVVVVLVVVLVLVVDVVLVLVDDVVVLLVVVVVLVLVVVEVDVVEVVVVSFRFTAVTVSPLTSTVTAAAFTCIQILLATCGLLVLTAKISLLPPRLLLLADLHSTSTSTISSSLMPLATSEPTARSSKPERSASVQVEDA